MSNNGSYRLNDDALEAIREMRRLFRKETGRDPGPNDPCGFDPDSYEPHPAAEARIKSLMGDVANLAGLAPDLAFAIRRTGLLVTQWNQDRLDENQLRAWKDALAEYELSNRVN
jgi:hypothetical protein